MTVKCPSGKQRFTSAEKADGVLGRIWSKPRPGRRMETRSYLCRDCAGWHLTSQPDLCADRPVPVPPKLWKSP